MAKRRWTIATLQSSTLTGTNEVYAYRAVPIGEVQAYSSMPEAKVHVLICRGEKVHSLDHITTREEKGGKRKTTSGKQAQQHAATSGQKAQSARASWGLAAGN